MRRCKPNQQRSGLFIQLPRCALDVRPLVVRLALFPGVFRKRLVAGRLLALTQVIQNSLGVRTVLRADRTKRDQLFSFPFFPSSPPRNGYESPSSPVPS